MTDLPSVAVVRVPCPACHSSEGVRAVERSSIDHAYYCPDCHHVWDLAVAVSPTPSLVTGLLKVV